jgi:hypothetical protein
VVAVVVAVAVAVAAVCFAVVLAANFASLSFALLRAFLLAALVEMLLALVPARPRPDRHPQKVRGLQDSDDRSIYDESVASDFSAPVTGWMKGSWMNVGQLSEVSIKSHCYRPLLNWTPLPPPLLHYQSSRPYLATTPCTMATLHAQPRWTPLL